MAISPDAAGILHHWPQTGPMDCQETTAKTSGFSGSLIWRIETGGGQTLCLRRWPREHPTLERLRLIHTVLTHVAARGIGFVPAPLLSSNGNTFVAQAGHLWELAPWLPGAADYRANSSRIRLSAAMVALAQFHLESVRPPFPLGHDWGEGLPIFAPAPALLERLQLVRTLLSSDFDRLTRAIHSGLSPELDHRASRILALTKDRLSLLQSPLTIAARTPLTLQPAIRDIHHEHVLFTGDLVTGLVDFGALRIDTPLTDLARLVGSLVADDLDARAFALEAYHQLRPLTEADRHRVDLLDASGLVLSGLNWLGWLYVERRQFSDISTVLRRLDEILSRLEGWRGRGREPFSANQLTSG